MGDDKRQQVLVLGRLGWSLRRIEEATEVRRETATYLSIPVAAHMLLTASDRPLHGALR